PAKTSNAAAALEVRQPEVRQPTTGRHVPPIITRKPRSPRPPPPPAHPAVFARKIVPIQQAPAAASRASAEALEANIPAKRSRMPDEIGPETPSPPIIWCSVAKLHIGEATPSGRPARPTAIDLIPTQLAEPQLADSCPRGPPRSPARP